MKGLEDRVDIVEEHDALVSHVLFDALDSLGHGVRTLEAHDTVIVRSGRGTSANPMMGAMYRMARALLWLTF
jgi:hypothetical protein